MIGFKYDTEMGAHVYADLGEAEVVSSDLRVASDEYRRLVVTQSPYSKFANYINSLTEERCDKLIEKMGEFIDGESSI